MQPPYNDRWERTKWYLFRNLLENPGFRLSPVPEESRSESSDDRPYSPLPELIVEREPNRHDESEEFYQGLEVRMKRYYRKLFVDDDESGGDEEIQLRSQGIDVFQSGQALTGRRDSDSEISEFEVNQSMTSTFIINANDHQFTEAEALRAIDNKFNSEKTASCSSSRNSESEKSSKHEETEVTTALSETHDLQVHNNETKTIDTESDSPQDCHKISTTKVDIHEEVKRIRPITRVFEDGSPVLIPTCYKFSRIVFGNVSRDIINAVQSDDNEILEDDNGNLEGMDRSESNLTQNVEEQTNQEVISIESDLTVEWLMKERNTSSNSSCKTVESKTNTGKQIISQGDDQDEIVDGEEIDDDNLESRAESDEEPFMAVERIGTDEFDDTIDIDKYDNSIEMAVTKGFFERKNKMKFSAFGANDRMESDSEEFEDVEVMRGTDTSTRLHDSLQRQSTTSQDSSVVGTFATRTSATEIEEVSDNVNDQINAMDGDVEHTPVELHQSSERETTTSTTQDTSRTSAPESPTTNPKFNDGFDDDKDESLDKEKGKVPTEIANTSQTFKHTRMAVDACNDIWSVSNISIDFDKLPPNASHVQIDRSVLNNKRGSDEIIDTIAPRSKKKKCKNVEIQTSATDKSKNTLNDLKNNLFVGTPLVFKLCGCKDHVCS